MKLRSLRLASPFLAGILGLGLASAQAAKGPPSPQNPSAMALVQQALSALGGNTSLTDVTLQATVTYTAGSDTESGTATLEAKGNRDGRIVLNLDGGERQEIRKGSAGAWVGPDGKPHAIALHNTWTDASWFFPPLGLQAILADPQLEAVYVGAELHNGVNAQRLRVSRLIPAPDPATQVLIQQLSTMDLYLDSASFLPAALDFNVHPNNDLGTNISVEIRFGDYRAVNGVEVPFHIRKYVQGTLTLDLSVSRAAIDSGVLDRDFTVPEVQK